MLRDVNGLLGLMRALNCEVRIEQSKKKKVMNRVCNRTRLFQSWQGSVLGALEQ